MPPEGLFPRAADFKCQPDRVGEAWLLSESLRMLVGETDLSQWAELEGRQAPLSVHGS